MKRKYLECAKIVNTHGVRGALRAECLCDSVDVFSNLETVYIKNGSKYEPHKLINAAEHKNVMLISIEGIDNLDAAISLKGTILYADRDDFDLDEGDYFIADLIGLPVYNADTGEKYGTLEDVSNSGASDIYTVKRVPDIDSDGKNDEFMIPAVPEFIIRIDTDEGIFIRPIEGMI